MKHSQIERTFQRVKAMGNDGKPLLPQATCRDVDPKAHTTTLIRTKGLVAPEVPESSMRFHSRPGIPVDTQVLLSTGKYLNRRIWVTARCRRAILIYAEVVGVV